MAGWCGARGPWGRERGSGRGSSVHINLSIYICMHVDTYIELHSVLGFEFGKAVGRRRLSVCRCEWTRQVCFVFVFV